MKRLLSIGMILGMSTILVSGTQAQSDSSYTSSTDSAYWEAKKVETQNKSTQMRKEYYEKYKAKWYDVSSLTADLLDGTKTEEGKFWDALKKLQNQHEMQGRKDYVTKLSSKWIDVSWFTETVMNDSGKFWELANRLYSEYEKSVKQAIIYKEEKKSVEEKKYVEEKKNSELKKTEDKKQDPKTSNVNIEKAKKLFIQTLDKVPSDKQATTYPRLEKNILRQIEIAKKRESTLLVQKLETMLVVLRDRMNNAEDDNSIINSLFSE